MSQENAEIVRAALGAWNAGDMETVGELFFWDHAEALEAVGLAE